MGYDGVELACWGDHFDVDRAAADKKYCKERWELLADHGLTCFAVSNHLVGQAVCDNIDERHKSILPPDVWGDGSPEGVRKRAAKKMITTGKAYRALHGRQARAESATLRARRERLHRVERLALALRLPADQPGLLEKGFEDFAKRWLPILDAFDKVDVNFGLEVHPTEIAFDIASRPSAH